MTQGSYIVFPAARATTTKADSEIRSQSPEALNPRSTIITTAQTSRKIQCASLFCEILCQLVDKCTCEDFSGIIEGKFL